MNKVYVYVRSAGSCTENWFPIVQEKPLTDEDEWDYAVEHAESYGVYQNDEGWEDGEGGEVDEPCCWLEHTITTLAELKENYADFCYGNDTYEDLKARLESEGMVWNTP